MRDSNLIRSFQRRSSEFWAWLSLLSRSLYLLRKIVHLQSDWIRARGRPVDAAVWGGPEAAGRAGRRQLYDLNPEAGLVPSSDKERT